MDKNLREREELPTGFLLEDEDDIQIIMSFLEYHLKRSKSKGCKGVSVKLNYDYEE